MALPPKVAITISYVLADYSEHTETIHLHPDDVEYIVTTLEEILFRHNLVRMYAITRLSSLRGA